MLGFSSSFITQSRDSPASRNGSSKWKLSRRASSDISSHPAKEPRHLNVRRANLLPACHFHLVSLRSLRAASSTYNHPSPVLPVPSSSASAFESARLLRQLPQTPRLLSQMSPPSTSPTPPLLLTKRLNAFLHANQSPLLPTLLLTTAHGKLLAHAGTQPVSLLRTHATVAASLLAIHTSSSVDVPSALPGARTPPDAGADDESITADDDDDYDENHVATPRADGRVQARRRVAGKPALPVAITVQLSGGTVVIRRLKCNLLFVAIGPSAQDYHHPPEQHHHHHHHAHHENGDAGGSPSEVESLASAGCQTTSSLESVGASSAGHAQSPPRRQLYRLRLIARHVLNRCCFWVA
ncbi:hypothetical protein XA68_12041 [Ophiocordyceps unilateralis]|uniref:Uncharacterized protein n=1 Tax=Ophiocordyceps unilateralis TaxID=268505 RepID=A0A2A9PFJ1_OPHUN|nr:hypothetical protein XA68_12041 [Ophiocordyceps unilateralis]